MLNRFLILASFGILITSCSSTDNDHNKVQSSGETVDTLSSAEYLIVPGQSIGKLKLDSNAAYVYDMLGKPDAGDAAMGKAVATWYDHADKPNKGISIYTAQATENPPALIKQIRVTSAKYHTKNGIGPGTALNSIEEHFSLERGEGYKAGADSVGIYSDRLGISFEIDKNQKCIGVLVYPKGTLKPDTYLKFLP